MIKKKKRTTPVEKEKKTVADYKKTFYQTTIAKVQPHVIVNRQRQQQQRVYIHL